MNAPTVTTPKKRVLLTGATGESGDFRRAEIAQAETFVRAAESAAHIGSCTSVA